MKCTPATTLVEIEQQAKLESDRSARKGRKSEVHAPSTGAAKVIRSEKIRNVQCSRPSKSQL